MPLSKELEKHGINLYYDADTSKISSIRAGGIAKYIVFPRDKEQLVDAIRIAKSFPVKYKIIGKATNVFFSDKGFGGLIISTSNMKKATFSENGYIAEAGVSLPLLIRSAARDGIRISPELSGIPGSIGGAVRNNAGAYGKEISDVFEWGEFYSVENDAVLTLTKSELDFSYRASRLVNAQLVLLSAKITAERASVGDALSEISGFTLMRRQKQPSEASLGSFFKRSSDVAASQLIDACGLKGFSVGGASISEKHAGFIINNGNATSNDINELADFAENKVYRKFGIRLTREAEFIE